MSEQPRALHRLDLKQILWLVVFGLMLSSPERVILADADLVTHIAVGRRLLAEGFAGVGSLLYTTDVVRPLHEWLFQAVMALLDGAVGLGGPYWVASCLIATVPALVYVTLRREATEAALAIGAALVTFLAMTVHLGARPHIVTWLLLVLWWRWATAARTGRLSLGGLLARLVPTAVLWANVHGGFLAGLVLLGLMALGELVDGFVRSGERESRLRAGRHLAVATAGSALAGCVNPYGPSLYLDLVRFLTTRSVLDRVEDFRPLDTVGAPLPVFLLVLVIVLAALWVGRRAILTSDLLLLAMFATAAVTAARHVALFGIVGGLVAARVLSDAWQAGATTGLADRLRGATGRLEPRGVPAGWRIVTGSALVAAVVLTNLHVPLAGRAVPGVALSYLNGNPDTSAQRGYADFMLGGFVLYATRVQSVFVHPLNALYPDDVFEQFVTIVETQPGWEELLDRYEVEWALVEPYRPIAFALARHRCWRAAAHDRRGALFLRVECD